MRKLFLFLILTGGFAISEAQTPSGSQGATSGTIEVAPIIFQGNANWNTAGSPAHLTTKLGHNSDSTGFEYSEGSAWWSFITSKNLVTWLNYIGIAKQAIHGTPGNLLYYGSDLSAPTTPIIWDSAITTLRFGNNFVSFVNGANNVTLKPTGFFMDNGSTYAHYNISGGLDMQDVTGNRIIQLAGLSEYRNLGAGFNTIYPVVAGRNLNPSTSSALLSYGPAYTSEGSGASGATTQPYIIRHYMRPEINGTNANMAYTFESSWNGNAYITMGNIYSFSSGSFPSPGGAIHFDAGVFDKLSLGYGEYTTSSTVVHAISNVTSGTITMTLPNATVLNGVFNSNVLFGNTYKIINSGSGTVTVATAASQNITNGSSTATTFTLTQGQYVELRVNAAFTAWYVTATNAGGGGGYTLPIATLSTLGGIKPDQTTLTVNGSTGAASAAINWGSWTPTLINSTNVSGATLTQGVFSQVGNIVTATFSGACTVTTANSPVIITFNLPVNTATTFQGGIGGGTIAYNAGGLGYASCGANVSSSSQGQLFFTPSQTVNDNWMITIQYHTN